MEETNLVSILKLRPLFLQDWKLEHVVQCIIVFRESVLFDSVI